MTIFGYFSIMMGMLFWIFRVVVAFTSTMKIDFLIQPLNNTVEILLLFFTLVCFFLIFKRSIIGALAYLISYLAYFGIDAYKAIIIILENEATSVNYTNLIISVMGVVIALLIFIQVGLSEGRKKGSSADKNTNWFYGTHKYERKYDERADRNQYKF